MGKTRMFDPMGKNYDMKTSKEAGNKSVFNPEDKKMHWPSLDPRTGMVLKGRPGGSSWLAHEVTEAAMGAKQVFKKGRYYTEGSGPIEVKQKPGTNIKKKGSVDFKKQQYIDSITPKTKG